MTLNERRRAAKTEVRKLDDLFPSPRVQVAATELQHTLVAAALAFHIRRARWPSATELAVAADVDRPSVWTELKVLTRLGLVAWRKVVEVLRAPDGVFFLPKTTERACEPAAPRGVESGADCYVCPQTDGGVR